MHFYKARFLFLLFYFFVDSANGQDVKFYVQSDASQIAAGNYFELSFTIENAQGSAFRPPSFKDFNVASGPNQSSQMSIINGRTSQSMSISYVLSSERPGSYILGPASVLINGKEYKTSSIKIEVIKTSAKNNPAGNSAQEGDNIILTELDYDKAYVGQQLSLKYVLLTNQDVRSYNFGTVPEFDGFFAQEIQNYNERAEQIIYNGKQYVRRVLKAIALYPQQKGEFELPAIPVELGIADPNQASGFFFNVRLKPQRFTTENRKILVTSPMGVPPGSFSGAIGKYQMSAHIDKKTISLDDALTLTMQLRGDGDPKFLLPPQQDLKKLFDVYEPNKLSESIEVVQDKVQAVKTFEYLMVPRVTGELKFTPSFTYFDPDSKQYVTIEGQEYTVNVLEGSTENKQIKSLRNEVILPPIENMSNIAKTKMSFAGSPIYWVCNGVLLMSFIGLFIAKKIQVEKSKIDPTLKRYSKARKFALQHLKQAETHIKNGNNQEFYIQLRKALLEYLASKTKQASAQLSKETVAKILAEYSLTEFENDILEILQKGEQAIYAFNHPGGELESHDRAVQLIESMEQYIESRIK